MKTRSIVIRIDDRITDIITYHSEKRNLKKELELIIKLINSQVCNIKIVEVISNHRVIITSEKGATYNIVWTHVISWDESELTY